MNLVSDIREVIESFKSCVLHHTKSNFVTTSVPKMKAENFSEKSEIFSSTTRRDGLEEDICLYVHVLEHFKSHRLVLIYITPHNTRGFHEQIRFKFMGKSNKCYILSIAYTVLKLGHFEK